MHEALRGPIRKWKAAKMRKRLAAIALIGIMTGISNVALAGGGSHSLEQVLVETAQTAAEHQALAHHFRANAADARDEAALHEKMGKGYMTGKATERMQMQRHCKKIADSFKAQAAEYDAMANLHDTEAKKLAK